MDKRKRRIIHILMSTVIACVVVVISFIYMWSLTRSVQSATMQDIIEMAKHDRNSIETYVKYNWESLRHMALRLYREDHADMRELQERMLQEREDGLFNYVYIVDEEGTTYTDTFLQIPKEEQDFTVHFLSTEKFLSKTVFLYEWVGEDEKEEYLVYGINLRDLYDMNGNKVDSPVFGGRKMFALLGFTKINSIQDGLIIDLFNKDGASQGYSAVVDGEGNYIVDIERTGYVNQHRNLFNYIDACHSSSLSGEGVQAKMNLRETFKFSCTEQEGGVSVSRVIYCMPFENSEINWYFTMSVEESVFNDRSSPLISLNLIELIVVIIIVIVALLVVMFTQSKAINAIAKSEAQSEFLSNMSHEIRTPLNGIVGLNYLAMNAIDDPEKQDQVKEWLDKTHSTANYLLSLVNDVLDMSKLQAGKVDLLYEPILFETIVDAIWSMQRDNIESRGVHFITDINIDVPCVLGDEVRIKQILMNIVGNAAKFTPKGGQIKLTLKQRKLDENHVATTFICEDTGCGMSKEFLSRIFDAFEQERNRNQDSIKGTGLGMAISKLLVDAMHGMIKVESELGVGSRFTIIIPSEISSIPDYMKLSPEAAEEKERVQQGQDAERPVRVLVAEDNELNAEILLEILNDSGFETKHAVNGQEAVDIFSSSQVGEYDVILMDMRMPVMDGCTATKHIRELPRRDAKTVPIFACTANTFEHDRVQAMESGMNDFLAKPIDVKVFLQKMEAIGIQKKRKL